MRTVDHEMRALRWTLYLMLASLVVWGWYWYIRPGPWALVVPSRFYVNPVGLCLPCVLFDWPIPGPPVDATIASTDSILAAMLVFLVGALGYVVQLAIPLVAVVWVLYHVSRWVEGDR